MTTQLPQTPGQTVGPFFHDALVYEGGSRLVPPGSLEAIRLHGHVIDGSAAPVPDALVEIWQSDPSGYVPRRGGSLNRDDWTFTGWGRAATDTTGHFSFSTCTPGAVGPEAAAFFAITVFARGLLDRLFTRAYLPTRDVALASDQLLNSLEPERRRTLIATSDEHGYLFDIHLQGESETVFLTYPGHHRHTGMHG